MQKKKLTPVQKAILAATTISWKSPDGKTEFLAKKVEGSDSEFDVSGSAHGINTHTARVALHTQANEDIVTGAKNRTDVTLAAKFMDAYAGDLNNSTLLIDGETLKV